MNNLDDILNTYLAQSQIERCALYRVPNKAQLILLEVENDGVSTGDFWAFTAYPDPKNNIAIAVAVVSEQDFEGIRSGNIEMTPMYGNFEDLELVYSTSDKYENHPKPKRNENWDGIPDNLKAGYDLAVKEFIDFISELNSHSAYPDVEIGYLLSALKSGKFRKK